jgi:hypothetical protein
MEIHTMAQLQSPAAQGWRQPMLLLAGDLLVLTIFATIGRFSHAEGLSVEGVTRTAAPFIAGWLAAAPLTRIYQPQALPGPRPMAWRSALNWLLALPLALGLRALIEQRSIPLSFALVAGSFTLITLVGWRTLLALLRHYNDPT